MTSQKPTIQQMMKAMNLRSPAPVEARLRHMKAKAEAAAKKEASNKLD